MTTQDAKQILSVLRAAYPQSFSRLTETEIGTMTVLWRDSFKTDEYETVRTAVQTLIENRTDRFAPTIAEVKAEVRAITANSYRSGPEELEMLRKLAEKWAPIEETERASGIDWAEIWMRDPYEITRMEQEGVA